MNPAAAQGYGMWQAENLLVIVDFKGGTLVYPLCGWMGRPSKQKR